ncbi:MAG: kynureninase [Sphingobacteriales bacterium 39-19]|nr:kynureninase [Sphingobacteriales bacterium]OJW08980.1 MAG: kynureninase [Sphingobacteriales bacterium 39-19]
MQFKNTLEYAQYLDEQDHLKSFRDQFYIPLLHGKDAIYFTGNSLGLQPKTTQDYVLNELEDWANYGVEGHLNARNPWMYYHEMFTEPLTKITGALPTEVVAMNQLTVNLHLLLVSFYRPSKQRYKIICEAKAFPSDQYALESQVKLHGFNYDETVIEIAPEPGEHTVKLENILAAIDQHKNELALVILGAVNYYNGQVYNMEAITKAAHAAGAYAGFDLAHAAGNIELKLHEWDVDFACWCSYKYLNSGPGGVAGVYIHERHAQNTSLPRFAGWWGYPDETRFEMKKGFIPTPTAEGWQLSNAPILSMAAHKASLDIFDEAGMVHIAKKGKDLSSYLMYLLHDLNSITAEKRIEVITPSHENERGCQVSMLMLKDGKKIFETLKKESVIADWREPNVIRVAPVALYNRFEEVFRFYEIIRAIITAS